MTWAWFLLGYLVFLAAITFALRRDPPDDLDFDEDWP